MKRKVHSDFLPLIKMKSGKLVVFFFINVVVFDMPDNKEVRCSLFQTNFSGVNQFTRNSRC